MAKSGKLIIFNMEEFEQQQKTHNLPGNKKDVEILQETFKKYNADVDCVYTNYTLDQIKTVIKNVQKEDFSIYKYLVVAVLTHGDRKEVLLSTDDIFDLDTEIIFPIFSNATLKNKPKLFIIDACKGTYDLVEAETNATKFNDIQYCPRQAIRCFATSEGFKAYGTEHYGSYFVQVFCEKLMEKGDNVNVKTIMEECISAVEKQSKGLQIPSILHNMTEEEVKAFTLGNML